MSQPRYLKTMLAQARLNREARAEQAANQALANTGQSVLRYMAMYNPQVRQRVAGKIPQSSRMDELIAQEQAVRGRMPLSDEYKAMEQQRRYEYDIDRDQQRQEQQLYRSQLKDYEANRRAQADRQAAARRAVYREKQADKRHRRSLRAAKRGTRQSKKLTRYRKLLDYVTEVGDSQSQKTEAYMIEASKIYATLSQRERDLVASPWQVRIPAEQDVLERTKKAYAAKTKPAPDKGVGTKFLSATKLTGPAVTPEQKKIQRFRADVAEQEYNKLMQGKAGGAGAGAGAAGAGAGGSKVVVDRNLGRIRVFYDSSGNMTHYQKLAD